MQREQKQAYTQFEMDFFFFFRFHHLTASKHTHSECELFGCLTRNEIIQRNLSRNEKERKKIDRKKTHAKEKHIRSNEQAFVCTRFASHE